MKRLAVLVLLVVVCGAAVLWIGRERWQTVIKNRLERQLNTALAVPVKLGSFSIELSPLRISAQKVQVGDAPVLGEVDSLELRLIVADSFRERRPVVEVAVDGPAFDLTHLQLPAATTAHPAEPVKLPSIDVRSLRIRNLRLRFPMNSKSAAMVTADEIGAGVSIGANTASAAVDLVAVDLEHKEHHARIHRLQAR
ncbi:MAG TPA: hypothetical protein VMT89_11805, partial [Candidatus Acidoferrales bacterium]|nr:hypothetical protein [Candidatus Acidoferrales bacterium]